MYDACHTILSREKEVAMISVRLNDASENELKMIAKFEGVSVSEYVRNIINEKLEDLYDLQIGTNALEQYNKNPVTFTMDEVFKD